MQGLITVVDFAHALGDGDPALFAGDRSAHLEVDAGNKEISPWCNKVSDVAQAVHGFWRTHMAEEAVGNDDFLGPAKPYDEVGIIRIAAKPLNALAQPRLDDRLIAADIEHGFHFLIAYMFEEPVVRIAGGDRIDIAVLSDVDVTGQVCWLRFSQRVYTPFGELDDGW